MNGLGRESPGRTESGEGWRDITSAGCGKSVEDGGTTVARERGDGITRGSFRAGSLNAHWSLCASANTGRRRNDTPLLGHYRLTCYAAVYAASLVNIMMQHAASPLEYLNDTPAQALT